MVCIHCSQETQVVNSRWQRRSNQVWRRRKCTNCGALFTTEETAEFGAAWLVKGAFNDLKPFSRDKLFLSLYDSCGHRKTALQDASGLTETVINKLMGASKAAAIDSQVIAQVTLVALNRFDRAAAVHYQARHKG